MAGKKKPPLPRPIGRGRGVRLYADQDRRLDVLGSMTGHEAVDLFRIAIDGLLEANGVTQATVDKWDATKADRVVIIPTLPGPVVGSR